MNIDNFVCESRIFVDVHYMIRVHICTPGEEERFECDQLSFPTPPGCRMTTYGVESCSFKGDALPVFFSVWRLQKIDAGTKKMMCHSHESHFVRAGGRRH